MGKLYLKRRQKSMGFATQPGRVYFKSNLAYNACSSAEIQTTRNRANPMNTSRTALLGLALSVPLALTLLSSASAQSYNFTDFDAFNSGLPNTVNGISNSGSVIGTLLNDNGTNTNFSGMPGTFTVLNLPGSASANAINSSGQVVGNDGADAFVLNSASSPATEQLLMPVNDTTVSEAAFGINESGIIVGQYVDTGNPTASSLGFVDVQGKYTTLNPTGNAAVTSANGINNNGLVVGFSGQSSDPGAPTSGFLFDTLTSQYSPITDPAVSDLAFTQFLGINDSGEAVGYYGTNAGAQHGFLYDTTTQAYTFLDDPNAAPGDSAVTQITGITDSGEIAGFYVNADGAQLGFTATPAAVPESSSLVSLSLLLALGLGGVYAAKKRKVAA